MVELFFFVFSACWICIDLCFSACWPGCLASVYETFDSHTWPRKIGMLALAARTGNACAFLGFGSLLQIFAGRSNLWRLIFWVSSLIQLFPLLLLQYFGKSVKQPIESTRNLSTPMFRLSLTPVAGFSIFWTPWVIMR